MSVVRYLGLPERAFILVGVGPLRSAKPAEWTRSHVPGVVIPDKIINHLNRVPLSRQREEGKKICIEIIQAVREIEGVSGVHVMAYRQEGISR